MAEERVSPTAHYTGYVWARNGMSYPGFETGEGRLLYAALQPLNTVSGLLGGPTLEGLLLARHRLIDHLLTAAIDAGRVTQVIEIAAGLSPRGCRFVERYGEAITYVETDLPGMAARKRSVLDAIDALSDRHRVVELDALATGGATSLAAVAASLDPEQGTAIITEGLVNYFGRDTVLALWRRIAAALAGFRDGTYYSDLHLGGDSHDLLTRGFMVGLSGFVRGRVHLHFEAVSDATAALRRTGFESVVLHQPAEHPEIIGTKENPAARMVRVIEAGTTVIRAT
jgi:O-methyltransferase involved in polyketide biosynthesis